jgi:HAMP domain-containing protein
MNASFNSMQATSRSAGTALIRFAAVAALAIVLLASAGCYDAHALVDQVRTDALRNRLHEVDLGTYRTTMPRDPKTTLLMDMELHLFGTVPQYKIRAIEERLEADGYRLRSETLAAIRETSGDELAEPDLTHLRGRLTEVVNNILTDSPIKSVGIQDIKIVYE